MSRINNTTRSHEIPITLQSQLLKDTDGIWVSCSHGENDKKIVYQSKQMSGLFKEVYPNGMVAYHNIADKENKEERTNG